MRYALIDSSGNVVNVVEWDGEYGESSWSPDHDLTAVQSDTASVGWVYKNGEFLAKLPEAPQLTIGQAVQVQLQALQRSCEAAITSGFSSSALGKSNYYGSLQTDQINVQTQFAASQASSPPTAYFIYCSPTQVQNPPLVQHTQAQMLQVLADLNTWRTAQQRKYNDLVQRVQAAKTVADVQKVTWPS
ncbi:DUF4376 domain-containing protein [Chromobacterium haemolyticum]|uniref:DUF4376 domain-containing protein n=1 Tax=Chromobacterium haemolyticum TaxID=394935 RepID=UPI004055BFE1